MGRQKIVNKDIEFGQLIDYAGHRSRSSAGSVGARNHTLHRPFRNDSLVSKSILELAETSGLRAVWKGEPEGCTLARSRLCPDSPAMRFDNLLADRQTDTGSGVLLLAVKSLEGSEN